MACRCIAFNRILSQGWKGEIFVKVESHNPVHRSIPRAMPAISKETHVAACDDSYGRKSLLPLPGVGCHEPGRSFFRLFQMWWGLMKRSWWCIRCVQKHKKKLLSVFKPSRLKDSGSINRNKEVREGGVCSEKRTTGPMTVILIFRPRATLVSVMSPLLSSGSVLCP